MEQKKPSFSIPQSSLSIEFELSQNTNISPSLNIDNSLTYTNSDASIKQH